MGEGNECQGYKRKLVRDSIFAYFKLIQQTLFRHPQLVFIQSVLRLPPPITFKRLRVVKLIFLGQSTVPFDIVGVSSPPHSTQK